MNIFNSLGSNYTPQTIWKSLLHLDTSDTPGALQAYLDKRFGGQVRLMYKGREALAAALILSRLPKGSAVFITGYTCYAVYQAVVSAGLKPVYLDIEADDVNFSAATLEKACRRHPGEKAVIIQNTYGIPCDISRILAVSRKHGLTVIEDLAHSIGAVYSDGSATGTAGHFAALSLSQDKLIDCVSGGALVVHTRSVTDADLETLSSAAPSGLWRDVLYPFLTVLIRSTYPVFVGKGIHWLAKRSRILSTPMGDASHLTIHSLPSWHARMALDDFERSQENISHRRKIAAVYAKTIRPEYQIPAVDAALAHGSFIRFPIAVRHRTSLINRLKTLGVHIGDIWYDAPVAPKAFLLRTTYANECPHAEALSECILNLPTHRNISPEQALQIASVINTWKP